MSETQNGSIFVKALAVIGVVILGFLAITYLAMRGGPHPSADTQSPPAPQASTPPPASAAAPAERVKFKPEMLVRFPDSAPVCLTIEALSEALSRGARGEQTRMSAMFINAQHPDRPCLMIDSSRTYKVISVQDAPDAPGFGLLQIVGNGVDSDTGGWTVQLAARPVQ